MKKLLLSLLLVVASYSTFAQTTTERKTLFKSKYGYEIIQSVSNGDTTKYFAFSYQNMAYKTITDTGIILFTKKADLQSFVDKLEEFSNKEKGVDLSYSDKEYRLNLISSSNNIFIHDSKGKYTIAYKSILKKMLEELKGNISLLED